MKRVILTAVAALALFSGCANKSNAPAVSIDECVIDNQKAPIWVCDGGASLKGGLYAVGSAEPTPLGISFQRKEAMADARDALARRISIKVNNMFKQFQATTGIGKDQTADKATQNVSKQIASQTLNNSKLVGTWISPKGVMFVIIEVANPKQLKAQVKESVKTSFKNDKALWQEFKAKKAQDELDMAIEKEFGK